LAVEDASLDKLNALWESLILDLVSKRFPHIEQIAGVRIVDKSSPGRDAYRFEIWTKYDNENNDYAKAVRDFIEKEYNS
jgi:hypothetical protein